MPSRVNSTGGNAKRTTAKPKPTRPMASGRVFHSEKITVYVSSEEWINLEDARLNLRRAGIVVDRGRLVRAAIASALADLATKGEDADLLTRLGAS